MRVDVDRAHAGGSQRLFGLRTRFGLFLSERISAKADGGSGGGGKSGFQYSAAGKSVGAAAIVCGIGSAIARFIAPCTAVSPLISPLFSSLMIPPRGSKLRESIHQISSGGVCCPATP